MSIRFRNVVRGFLLVLTLSVTIALQGCATVPKAVPAGEQIQTSGYVVIRVVQNAPAIATMANSITAFGLARIEKDGEKKAVSLDRIAGDVYAGWAPAGTYQPVGIVAASGLGTVGVASRHSLSGTIQVKAGKVMDLQTLIYQPVGDEKAIFIPVARSVDVPRYVKKAVPSVASKLLGATVEKGSFKAAIPVSPDDRGRGSTGQGLIAELIMQLSDSASAMRKQRRWTSATSDSDLFRMAQRSTTKLNGGHFLADGGMVFGSSLGQVLLRDPSGAWRSLDTGRLEEVTDAIEANGNMIAIFADGRASYSTDHGKHWQDLAAVNLPDPAIRIYGIAGKGFLLVSEGGYWKHHFLGVYALDRLKAPQLKLLKKVPLDVEGRNLWAEPATFWTTKFVLSQGVLVMAPDDDDLYRYNTATGSWSTQKMAHDVWRLRVSNDGKIITDKGANGVFATDMISLDAGKTWQEVKMPTNSPDGHYYTPTKGVGMYNGSGSEKYTVTTDAAHWSHSGKMNERCVDFFAIDKSRRAICSTPSGKIISTTDGHRWMVERTAY